MKLVVDTQGKGDRVDKRRVELGLTERGYVEVVKGLAAGDKVVTVGQGGLRAKSLVRVVRERPIPAATDSGSSAGTAKG